MAFHQNGPQCSVCAHGEKRNIDVALLAGDSVRDVAGRYGLTKSTVSRHYRLHVKIHRTPAEISAPAIVQAMEDREAHLDVMRAMRDLHTRTLALLTKAEDSGDIHVALRAVREARGNLEMLGRLDGSLDGPVAPQSGNVSVTITYVDKQLNMPGAPPMLESGEGE